MAMGGEDPADPQLDTRLEVQLGLIADAVVWLSQHNDILADITSSDGHSSGVDAFVAYLEVLPEKLEGLIREATLLKQRALEVHASLTGA